MYAMDALERSRGKKQKTPKMLIYNASEMASLRGRPAWKNRKIPAQCNARLNATKKDNGKETIHNGPQGETWVNHGQYVYTKRGSWWRVNGGRLAAGE